MTEKSSSTVKKREDEQHLSFERAEILFFGVILGGLRLDVVEAIKKSGIGAIGGDQKCRGLARFVQRNARGRSK